MGAVTSIGSAKRTDLIRSVRGEGGTPKTCLGTRVAGYKRASYLSHPLHRFIARIARALPSAWVREIKFSQDAFFGGSGFGKLKRTFSVVVKGKPVSVEANMTWSEANITHRGTYSKTAVLFWIRPATSRSVSLQDLAATFSFPPSLRFHDAGDHLRAEFLVDMVRAENIKPMRQVILDFIQAINAVAA